jgi:hypothetical protein
MLKKTLIGVLLTVTFLSTHLIYGANLNTTRAQDYSGTPVGGIIWENTTWTLENSPYVFVDRVTVAPNATLTIEPGVVVNLDFWSLIIEGTLRAQGNQTHKIIFQSYEKPLEAWSPRICFRESSTHWNETTNEGCILEYALINVTHYQCETIWILGSSPRISNNIIYGNEVGAIRMQGGVVTNNTIIAPMRTGVLLGSGSLLYNIIRDASCGILFGIPPDPDSPHSDIVGNLLIDNWVGVGFAGGADTCINNNTIVRNTYGFDIAGGTGREIVYNNIHSNEYDVRVRLEDPRITINMTFNWWGTTNTSLIDEKIYDQNDNRRLSLVNYTPFLTSPAEFPLDKSPPVTIDDYDGLWHNSDFAIILTAADHESGVAETYYRINDGSIKTISTDGQPFIATESANNTLEYWSVDNAGNEEPHKMLTGIKLDKTAPTSSINVTGVVGNNDWFASDVTINLAASDNVSGLDSIQYSIDNITWTTYITPFNIADEGYISIYYKSTDKAGNVETIKIETIKIDKTPPSGSISIAEGATYTNSSSINLTLLADDATSGVAKMRFSDDNITWTSWEPYFTTTPWVLTAGDGTKTVYAQFMDNAGLTSNIYEDSIILDTTPPMIGTPSRIPEGDVEPDQKVKVLVNVTDSLSGIKDVTLSYNLNDSAVWIDSPMTFNSTTGLYETQIQVQQANTLVKYKITAYDNAGNHKVEDNNGYYYVYTVIPEFPSTMILSLFMLTTLIVTVLLKKKIKPKSQLH